MLASRSWFSRKYLLSLGATAAALAAAWALSPQFLAAHFSADLKLADYIVFRIGLLRAALACVPAALAAYALIPAQKRQDIISALGRCGDHPAAATGAWLLLAFFLWTENRIHEGDPNVEGFFTYGALRVMRGDIPCRDFFSYVFPGFYYYLAGLYKIFGASLPIARYGVVIIPKFLTAVILYHVSRFFLPKKTSLAIALLCGILTSQNALSGEIHASNLALLFSVSAILPFLYFFKTGRTLLLVIGGLLAGATALVKQDFGIYIFAGHVAGLSVALSASDAEGSWIRPLACYLLAWAGLLGIVAAACLTMTPIPVLHECYVQGPLAYMEHFSSKGQALMPLLGLVQMLQGKLSPGRALFQLARFDVALILVLAAVLFGSGTLLQEWRRNRRLDRKDQGLGLLILCALAFLGPVFKGGSQAYVGCGMLSVVVWAVLIDKWRRHSPQHPHHRHLSRGGILALLYYGFIVLLFRPLTPPPSSTRLRTPSGDIRCLTPQDAAELGSAIEYIRSSAPPAERIFLYTTALNNGFTLFYFLAQRDAGTRYHELFTGISTTAKAQLRIIQDLGENQVRWIVETPGTTADIVAGPLHPYIQSQYKLTARFGKFKILKRIP